MSSTGSGHVFLDLHVVGTWLASASLLGGAALATQTGLTAASLHGAHLAGTGLLGHAGLAAHLAGSLLTLATDLLSLLGLWGLLSLLHLWHLALGNETWVGGLVHLPSDLNEAAGTASGVDFGLVGSEPLVSSGWLTVAHLTDLLGAHLAHLLAASETTGTGILGWGTTSEQSTELLLEGWGETTLSQAALGAGELTAVSHLAALRDTLWAHLTTTGQKHFIEDSVVSLDTLHTTAGELGLDSRGMLPGESQASAHLTGGLLHGLLHALGATSALSRGATGLTSHTRRLGSGTSTTSHFLTNWNKKNNFFYISKILKYKNVFLHF